MWHKWRLLSFSCQMLKIFTSSIENDVWLYVVPFHSKTIIKISIFDFSYEILSLYILLYFTRGKKLCLTTSTRPRPCCGCCYPCRWVGVTQQHNRARGTAIISHSRKKMEYNHKNLIYGNKLNLCIINI